MSLQVKVGSRTYYVDVRYGRLRTLKRNHNIDLLSPGSGNFPDLVSDDDSLVNSIAELVHLGDDQKRLTDQELDTLFECCRGSHLKAFVDAIAEGLQVFFRESDRPEVAEQVEKHRATFMKAREALAARIREADLDTPVMDELSKMDLQTDFREGLDRSMRGRRS